MVETPQSRESSPSATAAAILGAARRRYERFGPRKTTMSEIAREAGCSRATLYLHFPNKEALYAGLLRADTQEFLRGLEQAVDSEAEAPEKLRDILGETIRIYSSSPVLVAALTGDDEMSLEAVARPVVEGYETRVIELLARVLDEGVAAGRFRRLDTDAVGYLMYQLGRVLVLREVSGRGDFPLEEILRVMDDVLGQGIRRAPGARTPRRRKRR